MAGAIIIIIIALLFMPKELSDRIMVSRGRRVAFLLMLLILALTGKVLLEKEIADKKPAVTNSRH